MLASVDVIAIIYIISFRHCFINRLNYLTYLSYQIGVLIIDGSLLCKAINANTQLVALDKIVEVAMFCILAFTLIKIILSLYRSGKELYSLFAKNRVTHF